MFREEKDVFKEKGKDTLIIKEQAVIWRNAKAQFSLLLNWTVLNLRT